MLLTRFHIAFGFLVRLFLSTFCLPRISPGCEHATAHHDIPYPQACSSSYVHFRRQRYLIVALGLTDPVLSLPTWSMQKNMTELVDLLSQSAPGTFSPPGNHKSRCLETMIRQLPNQFLIVSVSRSAFVSSMPFCRFSTCAVTPRISACN